LWSAVLILNRVCVQIAASVNKGSTAAAILDKEKHRGYGWIVSYVCRAKNSIKGIRSGDQGSRLTRRKASGKKALKGNVRGELLSRLGYVCSRIIGARKPTFL
jgi:hypothetical protein